MPLGWRNALPFSIGGSPTRIERTYDALRKGLGEGGSGPPDGLEDAWQQSEAISFALSKSSLDRAEMQRFPLHMTDYVPVFESIFKMAPAPTLAERQAAISDRYTREIDATVPAIIAALTAIDPNFGVDDPSYDVGQLVHLGRAFGPNPGSPGAASLAFGTGYASARVATAWPNYATTFVQFVRYTLPANTTEIPDVSLAAAVDYLCDILPSWVDFNIYNVATGPEGDGFYLDGGPNNDSLLDQTAVE